MTIGHPESKIDAGARCKSLKNWIEAKGLNLVIVSVLKETLSLCGPDDDGVVCTTRGESLAILGVRKAVNGIFVT